MRVPQPRSVVIDESLSLAYVTGLASDSLAVVDVSTPNVPRISGYVADENTCAGSTTCALDEAYDVTVSDGHAYVVGAQSSLAVINHIAFSPSSPPPSPPSPPPPSLPPPVYPVENVQAANNTANNTGDGNGDQYVYTVEDARVAAQTATTTAAVTVTTVIVMSIASSVAASVVSGVGASVGSSVSSAGATGGIGGAFAMLGQVQNMKSQTLLNKPLPAAFTEFGQSFSWASLHYNLNVSISAGVDAGSDNGDLPPGRRVLLTLPASDGGFRYLETLGMSANEAFINNVLLQFVLIASVLSLHVTFLKLVLVPLAVA